MLSPKAEGNKKRQIENKMVDLHTAISIMALKANDTNTPIKKQRLSSWITWNNELLMYVSTWMNSKLIVLDEKKTQILSVHSGWRST